MQIDLTNGVLPISKAASSLAQRLQQAKQTKQPVVITQKGRPAAILLDIETYVALGEAVKANTKNAE